tara:strand:+ start:107 stop:760 length:654 start_codon:yes stop_codon:yes gene_type:complete
VSENDSFIEEVTEEVRRDKLYLFLKRYGWIGVIFIIGIVIASVVYEIRSSGRISEARKYGDLLANSLQTDKKIASSEGVSENSQLESNLIVAALLGARTAEKRGHKDTAISLYNNLINENSVPRNLKDYAKFKMLILMENDSIEIGPLLADLISPNNEFNLLALEQKAMIEIKNKNWKEAVATLNLILSNPNSSQNLKLRAEQLQKAAKVNELSKND